MHIKEAYYPGNDNYIRVKKMFNPATGKAITDAVVTATVLDSQGVPVAGVSWPVIVPFDPSSNVYQVRIEGMQLVNKQKYLTIVDVDASGLNGRWEIWRPAITRRK